MAKIWAGIVRTKANNERAIQIRYLKNIWLSNSSRFSLAFNALDMEINENDEAEMTLSPRLKLPDLIPSLNYENYYGRLLCTKTQRYLIFFV
jgi:hypothetical protein